MAKPKAMRYPWDKWFKQRRFRLRPGKHFTCMPHSMSVQVRAAATKRGLRVRVLISPFGSLLVEQLGKA